jgi:hypothetical protein
MATRCNENHEALKADPVRWSALPVAGKDGLQIVDDELTLELRNCTCGSTLAIVLKGIL